MSVESRASWTIAVVALVVLSIAYGAPYIGVVALKEIAAELGGQRSVPALAGSLAWLGAAVGGIAMGRIADRVGVRWTVMFGAVSIAAGLAVSSGGQPWQLWLGHGLLIGLLGNAGINAPLYVYVTRWFDRRRGTALALISSGQYLAGAVWPGVFAVAIESHGWRQTMLWYGLVVAVCVVPLAAWHFRSPPEQHAGGGAGGSGGTVDERATVLGLRPNLAFGLMAVATFFCCVPMSMPQGHLVAYCGDLGLSPARGAAMLSVLLGCAIVSRQLWGWASDRIGGLMTILLGSAFQIGAMSAFAVTSDELGLIVVAAAFGLGFSGIIPAYVLAVREYFPLAEASWRVPTVLLFGGSGMAFGGWLAGVIYDGFGGYAPAFGAGIAFNAANLALISLLVSRSRSHGRPSGALA